MNTTQSTRSIHPTPRRRFHRTTGLTATSIVLGLVLAGCAASVPPSGVDTLAAAPPADAVAESIQNSREVLSLGEPALTSRQSRLTVFGFAPARRALPAPTGTRWLAADVEFCLGPTVKGVVPIERIREEFGVQTEAERLQRPDTAYGTAGEVFTEPGRTIVAEECLRGPVVFAVPLYDPARYVGVFVPGGVLRWDVEKRWERGR